jgi:hypothetical protein
VDDSLWGEGGPPVEEKTDAIVDDSLITPEVEDDAGVTDRGSWFKRTFAAQKGAAALAATTEKKIATEEVIEKEEETVSEPIESIGAYSEPEP